MSAAAGAPQPPNQPPSGPSRNPPTDAASGGDGAITPIANGWTKDEKTKTCKCEACGNRVRFWSYKCERCGRHICSECLDRRSEKSVWGPVVAHDHVTDRCWCHYRSNMNPKFANWKPPPPVRTEEEQKARESKGLVTIKRTAKSNAQSKPKADTPEELDEAYPPGHAGDVAPENPDKDYEGPQPNSDVNNRDKADRAGIKRKVYSELESDDEIAVYSKRTKTKSSVKESQSKHSRRTVHSTRAESVSKKATVLGKERLAQTATLQSYDPPHKSIGTSSVAHVDGTNTVIVGAGFVGLFVARELAMEAQKASIKHDITVIDIRDQECELASGKCAGFLTTSGMPDKWFSIANIARTSWQEVVSSSDFQERLDFSTNTLFEFTESGAVNHDKAPAWLQGSSGLSLVEDNDALGRINPMALGVWLLNECKSLKVNLRFNHYVSDVGTSDSGLSNVRLETMGSPGGSAEIIRCHNLILAAGPFTTGIFNDIFKGHSLKLENHVQGAHWYHVGLDRRGGEYDVGLRIPQAAKAEPRLEDEIRVVSRGGNMALEVSATAKGAVDKDLDRSAALTPRKGKTTELKSISAKYVNQTSLDVDKDGHVAILSKGRSELSVANGGRPIIDRVPASDLNMGSKDGTANGRLCDVWLCYGFGRYGTMLAPGAARMLVAKMFGTSYGADDNAFSLPENVTHKSGGKGKGKAI